MWSVICYHYYSIFNSFCVGSFLKNHYAAFPSLNIEEGCIRQLCSNVKLCWISITLITNYEARILQFASRICIRIRYRYSWILRQYVLVKYPNLWSTDNSICFTYLILILFGYFTDTRIGEVSKLLKHLMKVQYNYKKHVSMYNIETLSVNEPKMKIDCSLYEWFQERNEIDSIVPICK